MIRPPPVRCCCTFTARTATFWKPTTSRGHGCCWTGGGRWLGRTSGARPLRGICVRCLYVWARLSCVPVVIACIVRSHMARTRFPKYGAYKCARTTRRQSALKLLLDSGFGARQVQVTGEYMLYMPLCVNLRQCRSCYRGTLHEQTADLVLVVAIERLLIIA